MVYSDPNASASADNEATKGVTIRGAAADTRASPHTILEGPYLIEGVEVGSPPARGQIDDRLSEDY